MREPASWGRDVVVASTRFARCHSPPSIRSTPIRARVPSGSNWTVVSEPL
jgi:hypothetical protein